MISFGANITALLSLRLAVVVVAVVVGGAAYCLAPEGMT